jgi:hypothetical protein
VGIFFLETDHIWYEFYADLKNVNMPLWQNVSKNGKRKSSSMRTLAKS